MTSAGLDSSLQPVTPDQTFVALAEALHGGPAIAPLPESLVERASAVEMLQLNTPVQEPDAGVVLATSGSTGRPKGAVLSRTAVRAAAEAAHTRLGGPGDWALALPPYYIAGLMVLARVITAGTSRPRCRDRPGPVAVGGRRHARASLSRGGASAAGPRTGSTRPRARRCALWTRCWWVAPRWIHLLRSRAEGAGITVVASYGMTRDLRRLRL